MGGLLVTIIIQVFAKKVISYVWVFFAAFQVMILLTVNNNSLSSLPASVTLFFTAVLDIINLGVLKETLSEHVAKYAKFLSPIIAAGGLAIVGAGVAIGVTILALLYKFRTYALLRKVWNTVFWNFLIRYYMTVYINFW